MSATLPTYLEWKRAVLQLTGGPPVVFLDGMDGALMGVTHDRPPRAVYCSAAVLDILLSRGVPREDALEQLQGRLNDPDSLGEYTPVYANVPEYHYPLSDEQWAAEIAAHSQTPIT